MTHIAMHVERTNDPLVMRWVVRGDVVQGPAVIREIEEEGTFPGAWEDALSFGDIVEIVVGDGELRVRVRDESVWSELAPRLQQSLSEFLNSGKTIHVQTNGHSDEELAAAVQELLDGPLASYVASHGGKIELESVHDAIVTVRLIGACQGCSSAGTTLKQGIEEQLRAQYPEIAEVRSVDAESSLIAGARKLLPLSVK